MPGTVIFPVPPLDLFLDELLEANLVMDDGI